MKYLLEDLQVVARKKLIRLEKKCKALAALAGASCSLLL